MNPPIDKIKNDDDYPVFDGFLSMNSFSTKVSQDFEAWEEKQQLLFKRELLASIFFIILIIGFLGFVAFVATGLGIF